MYIETYHLCRQPLHNHLNDFFLTVEIMHQFRSSLDMEIIWGYALPLYE